MKIYKRGRYWYVTFYYRGRRYQRSLRTTHRRRAAEYARKLQAEIYGDQFLGQGRRVVIEAFAEKYLEHSKATKAPRTYNMERHTVKTLLRHFQGCLLSDITLEMAESYKMKRRACVGPRTVNIELGVLRSLLNRAVEWGYIPANPIKAIRLLKEPPGRLRFLSRAEIQALLKHCAPHLKPVVLIALNTGMRKSELLELRWDQIDMERGTITLSDTKNNETRIVPMNQVVRETLQTLPRNGERVFPFQSVKKSFRHALKSAGIEGVRFHDLRHTFASHLVMQGVGLRTVQQLLGHKTLRMVLRYSHLSEEHLQDSVSKLVGLFRDR